MGSVVMTVDRRTINILLASLEIEISDLADHMGYDYGYVINVLNGFADAGPSFRRAFGETIGSLVLGSYDSEIDESYPPEPLIALIEKRAAEAVSKRDFYRDLCTSHQALRSRKRFDGMLVDRLCCALGVHPSYVYGRDYDAGEAS
jgi:hypothetical protein